MVGYKTTLHCISALASVLKCSPDTSVQSFSGRESVGLGDALALVHLLDGVAVGAALEVVVEQVRVGEVLFGGIILQSISDIIRPM